MMKSFILKKLQKYVSRYFTKHPDVKLIVVVGSVGKTSTKRALADILSRKYRVRMHEGNHNTEFAAPLAILGIEYPSNIRNFASWMSIFRAARKRIRQPADVDVIIQELGTDHPGDIAAFGTYLIPDIALVTAVTPEHMEFFGTIEAVAEEELSVSNYSRFVLINRDDVEGRFADFETNANFATYGTTGAAEYRFEQQNNTAQDGYVGSIITPENEPFPASIRVVGEHSLRPIMGAVAAGIKLGLTPADIVAGIALVRPVPGRMNMLRGINGTAIIDDTYNSSPAAVSAALQTLYSYSDAPQRIALLGDMRELGVSSQFEHEKLGMLCDPGLLEWVVLVGPDSEKYVAPAARARGCQVHIARNALEAGEFIRSVTRGGAVILAKGSQNTIFLEEAVKILCDLSEHTQLVRQSRAWLKTKDAYFQHF
jgi:UDP-N-acetylmuramyl pentapeptide synthase